jgi:DNA-binding transcriptional LysR family regulator
LLPGSSRQLGIRHAILASQIRQLETVTGTALLRTGPNGMIVLTPDGEQIARDVRPVPEALTQSRGKNPSHAP